MLHLRYPCYAPEFCIFMIFLRIFGGFAKTFPHIPVKMGNKVKKILSSLYSIQVTFLWSWKILFCVCLHVYHFFSNGLIHNVVSTSPNVVKIDVENNNVVLTLSNVVQMNVEIDNVDSTLFKFVNSDVDVHNIVSTLIWSCVTSRCHINQKTTFKQRWNVCWTETSKF